MKQIPWVQRMEHFLTWSLLKGLMTAIRFLPDRALHPLSLGMGAAAIVLLPRRKKIGMDNLRLALGGATTEEQREAILRRSMANVAYGAIEMVRVAAAPLRFPFERIRWEGLEHLEKALKKGKGAILVGSHFGNFPLITLGLGRKGFPVRTIIRDPTNPRIAELFDRLRNRLDFRYIHDKPKAQCVRRALECLRNREVLFLQIDLNVIAGGAYVDFFGRQVPTFTGPVVFAQRTGSPILPLHGIREGRNGHRAFLGAPVDLVDTGDREADLRTNTALLTKLIEGHIRRFPESWWWLHRRWRKARQREEP